MSRDVSLSDSECWNGDEYSVTAQPISLGGISSSLGIFRRDDEYSPNKSLLSISIVENLYRSLYKSLFKFLLSKNVLVSRYKCIRMVAKNMYLTHF